MNRRTFLQHGVLAATALAMPRVAAQAAPLRTISYNVLAFRGYPETDDTRARLEADSATLPERTADALRSLSPSIVTLQEGPSEDVAKRFADRLGMGYAYFPGGWPGNDDYPGGFPGVIITPYPIELSENRPSAGSPHPERLFTRHLGRAELKAPFGRLHVVSTHFHASDHDARMDEAAAIVALIGELKATGPVLLHGDLNHKPEDPEYAIWTDAGLVDIGAAHGIGTEPTASSVNPRASTVPPITIYVFGSPE